MDLLNELESMFDEPKKEEPAAERELFTHLPFIQAHQQYCNAYGYIIPKKYRDEYWDPANSVESFIESVAEEKEYIGPAGMMEAQIKNGVVPTFQVKSPAENKPEPIKIEVPVSEPQQLPIEPKSDDKGQVDLFGSFNIQHETVTEEQGKATHDFYKDKMAGMTGKKKTDLGSPLERGIKKAVELNKETPILDKALQQSEQVTTIFENEEKGAVRDATNNQAVSKLYIGIDPGKQGGMVAIDTNDKIISKTVIPLIGTDVDPKGIFDFLNGFKSKYDVVVILEEVHSLHKMAASTNFSMGHTLGIILGIVIANQLKLIRVQPKAWQKEVWITSEIEYQPIKEGQAKPSINTKLTSMKAAHRLFPTADFRKSERSKNSHDGICDAVCLAEYGRRKNL